MSLKVLPIPPIPEETARVVRACFPRCRLLGRYQLSPHQHAWGSHCVDFAELDRLLAEGVPQAHGYAAANWTAPLLRTELARRGWLAAERRCGAHCTAWAGGGRGPNTSWDGPIWPTPRKKGVADQAAAVVAAGGEVWFGDETTRRARQGEQAVVVSGPNARRVMHGAPSARHGRLGCAPAR